MKQRWGILRAQCVADHRGKLGVLQVPSLPFVAQRVFYVFDVPEGGVRGSHAHRQLHQCLICLSGTMEVTLDDGREKETFTLNDPLSALYMPPLTWTTIANLSPKTRYFVLASAPYDESDYLRAYEDFVRAVDA
jgi:dTDP-4-dehydrorhamnose 3,5-epimerase-like enzyme